MCPDAAIDRMLIRLAPEEYAALREDEQDMSRRVRKHRMGVLDRIEADPAPDEAAAVWQRIREVAATVCEHDRRGKQYRLADGYIAVMHGEHHTTTPDGTHLATPADSLTPSIGAGPEHWRPPMDDEPPPF